MIFWYLIRRPRRNLIWAQMFIPRNVIKTKKRDSPKIKDGTNKFQLNLTFNCHIAGFLRAVNLIFDIHLKLNSTILLCCTNNIILCKSIYVCIVLYFDHWIWFLGNNWLSEYVFHLDLLPAVLSSFPFAFD